MKSRERFWKTMRFEPVDHLPFWSDWLGPWQVWQEQGLPIPEQFTPQQDFDADKEWFANFFNTEGMYSMSFGNHRVPIDLNLYPGFPEEVYEETDQYRVLRQSDGVIVRQFKGCHGLLVPTQFVDYPLKTRADWVRIRDQYLDPHSPGRYPPEDEWQALKTGWKNRDYVLSIDGGSFYGYLRNWIGLENLSYMLYENPALVQEMMDYLSDFYIEVLRKAVIEVEIDFAMFWEDMCYKSGPLLSPAMFRKFMLPNYQKETRFLASRGIELSWVDCDGNIEALLPLWLEGGVRGFFPLEVASGMDAARLRQQYGQQIVMWGNIDKRALISGKEAIDAELARLVPVAAQGGFIPLVDHLVPDDVPYANYLYYLEQRKRLFGWSPP